MSQTQLTEVKYGQLLSMKSTADGFKESCFYLMNQLLKETNEENYVLTRVDLMSVIISVGMFSLELYLKIISAMNNYKEIGKCQFIKTHNLMLLYDDANISDQVSFVNDNTEIKFANSELESFLSLQKDGFEEWRYSFCSNENINIDFPMLSIILNAFQNFVNDLMDKEYIPTNKQLKDIKEHSISL